MTRGKPKDGSKNPGGRPVEWTDERIEELAESLWIWCQEHTACYLETFCAQQRTYPQKLSELATRSPKFSEALKVAKASCASHLAEATAGGEVPPAFGIFALKQHGWKDRQEVEHTGEITSKVVQVELPKKDPA
jgi:hypothetical protein